MVSFQTQFFQLNQNQTKTILESDTNSKKRKWDEEIKPEDVVLPYKQWMNPKSAAKSFSDIELHLETPLPSEWQRCLDIQSGEIHFYNTRTQKRTVRDPRESPEEAPAQPAAANPRECYMSLDLELNLPCGSLNHKLSSKNSSQEINKKPCNNNNNNSPSSKPPSTDFFKLLQSSNVVDEKKKTTTLSEAGKDDDEAVEMVAAACMKCHMLVMLQKSSPTCPNCKFVHSPYQTPTELFKSRLSLSC